MANMPAPIIQTPTQPSNANITGGTATGLTKLGVRDTSAAFDAVVAATSSTPLSAERTLTFDLVNASRTVKVTANAELGGVNTGDQTVAGLGLDVPASGVVGAFTAGAASIAPGTDKASRYPIAAARTLSQASALTLATTGSPVVGNKIIACYALALGYVLSIVNGGPLANTLATFGATLPNPLGVVVYWDGTNYKFNGYVCMS